MESKVLVACIGNIFLGDDAFGVEVASRLRQEPLPQHVKVVDFGIRSYDLAYALMEPWDDVILVDALPRGGAPGTVYVLEPELPGDDATAEQFAIDAHSMNPVAVLQMVQALGGKIERMLVVGCEPSSVEPDGTGNLGLSPRAEAAVSAAIETIKRLIGRERSPSFDYIAKQQRQE
jgi:hydrogenase maturation protease